jgi:selenoprotein W-related protein
LKRELGIDADLFVGSRGVFDVSVDGTLIFSKHSAGRFPDEAELVETIRARLRP